MTNAEATRRSPEFLAGEGEMARRTSEFDWSKTSLGPIGAWSPALRTTLQIILASRFPHLLWWGPDYIQFYNDAYRPIPGTKHPDVAFGTKARDCWSEIWHVIGPLIDRPYSGGPATWVEDIYLEPNRHGFLEETHFTIAYSPVPDDSAPGGIGGVLATVHEITEKVIGERRIQALRDLGARPATAKTAEEACAIAATTLAAHAMDVPFALIYLIEPGSDSARLAGSTGLNGESLSRSHTVALDGSSTSPWPLHELRRGGQPLVVDDLVGRLGAAPRGPWTDPASSAVAMAIPAGKPGQIAGFVVAGLSPRLKFDEAYRGFLELAVAQISTAISNARAYEEEKKRAEELTEIDRLKNEFFSNVSHEFRTPLTLMLGPLEDEIRERPAARERLEVAHRNGMRLLKLVNTLLDFSRIEAGRVDASFEPVDLPAFTAELASVFRSAVEKAGVSLTVDCPPLDEPVYVDREMWEKIVLNLLSNAFKFTFEGDITVRVRRRGERVELSVADTGIGIPESERPKVFHRFHRVRGARSRTHEGSGIGLALVQELARIHGGEVSLESAEGRGSTFTVSIRAGKDHLAAERLCTPRQLTSTALGAKPFVDEALRWIPDDAARAGASTTDALLEREAASAEGNVISPHHAVATRRILVVDDNADMRDYTRRLLSPHYTVETAADGRRALESIATRRPDLVLTDVMMPVIDGVELLQRLRADATTRTIPVILLSARAGEEARIEGLSAGADDYLVKPFSARELLARIQSNLELARVRREVEAVLRHRSEQLETLINRAPLGIYLVDSDFRIAHLNPIAAPVFGEIPGGVIGRDFDEIVHVLWEKSYADEIVRIFEHTLSTGEPYIAPERVEHRIDRNVTECYEWRADRIRLPDRGESAYGVVCYFRDISSEVKARREREFLLESERAARAEADRAAHLKDEFLALLSHELRAPLNAIAGWTYLLKNAPTDPERVMQGAVVIERNTKIQTQLISDLLDMSRIAAGKLRLNVAVCSPKALIESAVHSMRPDAAGKGIAIETAIAEAHGQCFWDQSRISQVLSNLLSNALKFTPSGGAIFVGAKELGGSMEVTVRDNGIGIDAGFLPHLFDRFRQADASTTREHGGLGLGLALVKQLVDLHGGTVTGASEGKGKGATFRVVLPLVPAEWVRETDSDDEPFTLETYDLAGVSVLVVDDDANVVEMVKRVLEECRASVVTARGADEALATLEARNVDLILSDIGMPVRDGYSLIRGVRERGIRTPAIALTAFVRPEDQDKALRSGFEMHLSKPLNPARVVATVASLTGRHRAANDSRRA